MFVSFEWAGTICLVCVFTGALAVPTVHALIWLSLLYAELSIKLSVYLSQYLSIYVYTYIYIYSLALFLHWWYVCIKEFYIYPLVEDEWMGS